MLKGTPGRKGCSFFIIWKGAICVATMKLDYNSRLDTLYVALADKSHSYGDDSLKGIIIMRDIKTEVITGFTIIGFNKKRMTHALPILPNGLSWEKDILPAFDTQLSH